MGTSGVGRESGNMVLAQEETSATIVVVGEVIVLALFDGRGRGRGIDIADGFNEPIAPTPVPDFPIAVALAVACAGALVAIPNVVVVVRLPILTLMVLPLAFFPFELLLK